MLEDTWNGHSYREDLSGQMKTTFKDGYGTDVTSLRAFLRQTLSAWCMCEIEDLKILVLSSHQQAVSREREEEVKEETRRRNPWRQAEY